MEKKSIFLLTILLININFILTYESRSEFLDSRDKVSDIPTLTIYTYESLLAYGINVTSTTNQVFDAFEEKENCNIEIDMSPDAGGALAKAISQKDNPICDVIIGIDNVMIHEAKKAEILQTYTPNTISFINDSLVQGLDPEFYVTPYDYGLISLVYDQTRINASTSTELNSLVLTDFVNNSLLAKSLVGEDPTTSSTGLGFLMWTIGVYEKILNHSWIDFWKAVKDDIQIESSWGDAYFNVFYEPSAGRPLVVSYATDPAYNYLFYNDTSLAATVSHEGGSSYGWLQIEGLGIVKGSKNRELAEKFIDWFTNTTVQELVPENNWMFPVNNNTLLPDSYKYTINPNDVIPLNSYFTADEIRENIEQWKKEWNEIMILSSNSTPASFLLLIPLIFSLMIYCKKKY